MQQLKKYSSLLFLLTTLFTIVIINLSCEDNPVTPDDPPGRSDYIISVDTIDVNYDVFNSIWGTSENNMWAGGGGSEHIWHYDGTKWKALPIGSYPFASVRSIYGFYENDIWIAAAEGKILHYDGTSWVLDFRYGPSGNNPNSFNDIWGYSSNDIYAVGHYYENHKSYGIIFHYNGTGWKQVNIPKTEGQIWQVRGDPNNRSRQYFVLNNVDFQIPDSSRIFELNGENIREIYYGELFSNDASAPKIETINNKIYFGFNRAIHSFNGKNFILEKAVDIQSYSNSFIGRSINDLIFAVFGGFAHYNGSEIKYLYQNENTFLIFDYTITDNAFFAVAEDYDNRVNLVIKGILQNNEE